MTGAARSAIPGVQPPPWGYRSWLAHSFAHQHVGSECSRCESIKQAESELRELRSQVDSMTDLLDDLLREPGLSSATRVRCAQLVAWHARYGSPLLHSTAGLRR